MNQSSVTKQIDNDPLQGFNEKGALKGKSVSNHADSESVKYNVLLNEK